MTQDIGASVPDQALVSDQAAARLDPPGFDPSRSRWKGPDLYTHFRWNHVIVRWHRFDFFWHLRSRQISLVVWKWHQPDGEIFLRSLGFVIKPWADAWEAPHFWGMNIGRVYIRTYFHRARGMSEWRPKPDADGYVLLPPLIAAAAIAAEWGRISDSDTRPQDGDAVAAPLASSAGPQDIVQ